MRESEARGTRVPRRFAVASTIVAGCLLLTACGKKNNPAARVPATPGAKRQQTAEQPLRSVPLGYTEEGIASWYGIPYHGRPAADGEIYDMEKLVAAHRVLPFNTWLKVTNLSNGKEVNVRVIDRGPFVNGRLIDLSKAAARDLDLLGPGVGRVRVEVVGAPVDVPSDDFYAVQVGAFSQRSNAERVRTGYEQKYGVAQLALKQGPVPLWRVLVGREASIAGAQKLAATINTEGQSVFVVRLDDTIPTPPPAGAVAPQPE